MKEDLSQSVELKRARSEFQQRINGVKASELFYGAESDFQGHEDIKVIYQALLEGLNKPIRRLESIAFVWVVGKSE